MAILHEAASSLPEVRGQRWLTWLRLVALWRRRAHERSLLLMMSDRDLRDIGITRFDASWEANKPFWRA